MSVAVFATYVLWSPSNVLDARVAFVSLTYLTSFYSSLSTMSVAVIYIGQVCLTFPKQMISSAVFLVFYTAVNASGPTRPLNSHYGTCIL